MQNKPGRVIFDFYDYIFSMEDGLETSGAKKQWIADQYFCIQAADAICARDMQMQYRRKEIRLGHGKPLILFPEYCWNDGPLPGRRGDGEIHIAQVGWMGLITMLPFSAIGRSSILCIPRMATCGGFIIGVASKEPKTPPFVIVKVPPCISSKDNLPVLARVAAS